MERIRCSHCGDIIGVYEPMRLIQPDGTHRSGSPLSLREQLDDLEGVTIHEDCARAAAQGALDADQGS